MPFDISGVFSRLYSWVNDRDTGVKINAPRMDAEFNGVKDAINAIVGQTQPFINPVKAPSGTAALPSYTFDGDQDTGFYRVGANQMGLAQGGVGLGQLFARGNILGTVSQSGGVPTGAVIERGSNANGEYVRLADGSQMCWKAAFFDADIVAGATGSDTWTFPVAFAGAVVVTPSVSSLGLASNIISAARYLKCAAQSSSNSNSIVGWANDAATTQRLRIALVAIGRWF